MRVVARTTPSPSGQWINTIPCVCITLTLYPTSTCTLYIQISCNVSGRSATIDLGMFEWLDSENIPGRTHKHDSKVNAISGILLLSSYSLVPTSICRLSPDCLLAKLRVRIPNSH